MDETITLNAEERRFIEEMGLHFEGLGAARISGRLFALLLVAPRPLRLEEIADLLMVSRASVSTNTRVLARIGIVDLHGQPGDRRRYYTFSGNAWEQRLKTTIAEATRLRQLVDNALEAVAPDNGAARDRLEVADAFTAFLHDEAEDMLARWRAKHRALERKVS